MRDPLKKLGPLRKYIYWSLGFHFGFFLLFFGTSFFGFHPFKFHQDKIVWVSLPKGVNNQMGSPLKKSEGLPKTTIQQQKQAQESPPVGTKKPEMTYHAPKPAQKIPPKKEGQSNSQISDALAKMQRLKNTPKPAPPEAAQIPNATPGGFAYGNSKGPYVSPTDPEYVMYQAKIRQRIMTEWIPPMKFTGPDAINLGLLCKIVVHMNDKGEVIQTEWEQKSGNPSFDLSALRAIEKAAPLDIPPDRLKYEVYNEGFIIEFNPQAAH